MSFKIAKSSKAPRRLVACADPAPEAAYNEAMTWLAGQLRAEAALSQLHRAQADRFNEIRRTGRAAESKVA